MAHKGLILRQQSRKGTVRYMAAQYVVGIWEYQVDKLDRELIKDMNEYIPALFAEAWKFPQMRTIPVGRSLSVQHKVLSHEKAEELVRSQKRFGVRPCICRQEHAIMGEGCGKLLESCLVFGMAVDHDRALKVGREIDVQEALHILQQADKEGLVLQPSNSRDIVWICCCCGCCCQILKNIKRHPRPASLVSTPFRATADSETCSGCGICVDRCQMEAISLESDTVLLNSDRCIGCGLCVSTCPTGSLTLVRKPSTEQTEIPRDIYQASYKLAKTRGKLRPTSILKMMVRSKIDRLLAPKST